MTPEPTQTAHLAVGKLFISHSSQDDGFVCELQHARADLGQTVWIDSRELRGGDPLWVEIKKAITESTAYAVLVSPAALQSKWVGKELRHAMLVQEQRGPDQFPVIPLSLDDTKLGVSWTPYIGYQESIPGCSVPGAGTASGTASADMTMPAPAPASARVASK